ncbi:MAG: hypothetical protein KC547_00565 [Anaerolineae bacterium]|nr:hypothetical protein [Anaerolineae bacterium]MCA9908432.1 hypothetical protein [Anaerolineae bacterium]
MTWRIQLPQSTIRRVNLLTNSTSIVAVWSQADHVHFFDQRNGKALGERVVESLTSVEHEDERWRTFLKSLRAPNDAYLPYVRTSGITIMTTADGNIRLYQKANDDSLAIEIGGKEYLLEIEPGARFLTLDMDLTLGLIAALDTHGRLHVYQQRIRVGIFDLGLSLDDEYTPTILVPDGGKQLFVTDGKQIVVSDTGGKILCRMELHYPLGLSAVTPDGKTLMTSDADTGVLRAYSTEELSPTHQRFAIDLAADARRLNPAAALQPGNFVPSTLAINNRGVVAFGLVGLLCVTSLSKMKAIPASTPG